MSKRPALLLALAAAALIGCGSDDDPGSSDFEGEEAEVAAVIDRLSDSARQGDGDTICNDLFTSNLRISIRRASGQPCSDEVTENIVDDDTKYTTEDVTVEGARATARVKDQKDRMTALLLEQVGGEWRIARIG
jgi:hypothetical protein